MICVIVLNCCCAGQELSYSLFFSYRGGKRWIFCTRRSEGGREKLRGPLMEGGSISRRISKCKQTVASAELTALKCRVDVQLVASPPGEHVSTFIQAWTHKYNQNCHFLSCWVTSASLRWYFPCCNELDSRVQNQCNSVRIVCIHTARQSHGTRVTHYTQQKRPMAFLTVL